MNEDNSVEQAAVLRELKIPLSLIPGIQPEELYHKLVMTSPDIIAITNLSGKLLFVSPAAREIFGAETHSAYGTSVFEWLEENDRERAREDFTLLLQEKQVIENRYKLKKRDGSTFFSEIHSTLLRDHENHVVGMICTLRDISRHMKEQEEIRQNEIRYKLLFETAHDSVFLMKEDIFVDCNSKALETFGCMKEEIIGRSPLDFSPPQQPDGSFSKELAFEKIHNALKGKNQVFEWRHRKFSGVMFDAEVSLNAFEMAGQHYLQAVVRNISKRKKSDEQLRKFSECLLSFTANPDHNISLLTVMCGEILGAVCSLYAREKDGALQISGHWRVPEPCAGMIFGPETTLCEAYHRKSRDIQLLRHSREMPCMAQDPIAIATKTNTLGGIVAFTGDQPKGILAAYFHNDYIPDIADRYFIHLIGSAIGVEEDRKASQDKLTMYTEELAAQNLTKDKFFSIIAHDLKGPFNAIMGFSDILTTEWSDFTEEERLNFLNNINTSAKNTYRLLENLLEWATTQTGVIKFQLARIDLSLIANDIVILLRELADKKRIKLYTAINFNTMVMADENMVRTILRNLTHNAIKFTPEGGQVRIFTRDLHLSLEQPPMIEVCVEDTGIGIDPEILGKLFKIDEKVRTPGTASEKGTGLGLILCRELIEMNHGKIAVKSDLGKGSLFSFTLPSTV